MLLQPGKLLRDIKDIEDSKLKKHLEEIMNDDYLKFDCRELPPGIKLYNLVWIHLIAVGVVG